MPCFQTEVVEFVYIETPWADRVEEVCQSWENTPYMIGQSMKGEAVDCIHFMGGCLDELYGIDRSKQLTSLRGDAALHSPEDVRRAMKAILRTYPKHLRITDGSLEAGDVLVTGPARGGPGHVLLASNGPGRLWHASSGEGVRRAGWGLIGDHQMPYAVYRATDKKSWI